MNEYNVSDYGIFTNAISTTKTLNTNIDTCKASVGDCKNVIGNDSVFMGPAADSCREGLNSSSSKLDTMSSTFTTIANYLAEASKNYQAGDQAAQNNVLGINSTQFTSNVNTGNANRDFIYNYLITKGYSKAGALGIISNIRSESNYKPDSLGDSGTSYGICQWHKGRWDNLKKYCSDNGKDASSLEGQLDFLMYELESKYPKLNNQLKNAGNSPDAAFDAAYQMTVQFERPAGKEKSGTNRGNHARVQLWETYKNA